MKGTPPWSTTRRKFIQMTAAASATLLGAGATLAAADETPYRLGRGQTLNLGWRFRRGHGEGFEAADFNDADWRAVDLPHDFSIENLPQSESSSTVLGPFNKDAVGKTATGFTVGGEGWYRKRFRCDIPNAARVEVLFEGIYMNSDIWINGHLLGNHYNGYTPIAFDLTPYLLTSGPNVLAVRVKNEGRNTRWYSGSGIYRNVSLDVLPGSTRLARWGIGVSTARIAGSSAELEITARLESPSDGLTLRRRIQNDTGRTVWSDVSPAGPSDNLRVANLSNAGLWSPKTPVLYHLHTELLRGGIVLDQSVTPFGVRIVQFDATTGMTVNGVATKMRGGCVHHDNGLLGAAAFDAAEERKVRLLKARGYNAIRTSHNPFSTAFLDACDRLGMLVISEAFDMWVRSKGPEDYSVAFKDHWQEDLDSIILSQRNHPSIVAWSIGNEIAERNLPIGLEIQWQLANRAHTLDPTRPVTAAINDFPGRPVVPSKPSARAGSAGQQDYASSVFLDLVGYNYAHKNYAGNHQRFPSRVMMGTESFPKDMFDIWELVDSSPYLIGDFVWSAMDYLGEVGLGGASYTDSSKPAPTGFALSGNWPGIISMCGDLDIIGCQKAASLARDVVWGVSELEVAVRKPLPDNTQETLHWWGWSDERPSWTWPGAEGKSLAVRVYTSGDRVELKLNGASVAQKTLTAGDKKHVQFDVPYQRGSLEAIAYLGAKEIARRQLVGADAPVGIKLTAEPGKSGSSRGDLTYLMVEIIDANGRHAGDVSRQIKVSISGPADLVGFGSADPYANPGYQGTSTKTYDGRALLILRGTGHPGNVAVTVTGEGLQDSRKTIAFG